MDPPLSGVSARREAASQETQRMDPEDGLRPPPYAADLRPARLFPDPPPADALLGGDEATPLAHGMGAAKGTGRPPGARWMYPPDDDGGGGGREGEGEEEWEGGGEALRLMATPRRARSPTHPAASPMARLWPHSSPPSPFPSSFQAPPQISPGWPALPAPIPVSLPSLALGLSAGDSRELAPTLAVQDLPLREAAAYEEGAKKGGGEEANEKEGTGRLPSEYVLSNSVRVYDSVRLTAGRRVEGRLGGVWRPGRTTTGEQDGFVQIRWDADGSLIHLKIEDVRLTASKEHTDEKASLEAHAHSCGHPTNPHESDRSGRGWRRKRERALLDLPKPTTGSQLVRMMSEEDDIEQKLLWGTDDHGREWDAPKENRDVHISSCADPALEGDRALGRGDEFPMTLDATPSQGAASDPGDLKRKNPRKTESHVVNITSVAVPKLLKPPKGENPFPGDSRLVAASRLCIYLSKSAKCQLGWGASSSPGSSRSLYFLKEKVERLQNRGVSILESPTQLSAFGEHLGKGPLNPSEEVRDVMSFSFSNSRHPQESLSLLLIYLVGVCEGEEDENTFLELQEEILGETNPNANNDPSMNKGGQWVGGEVRNDIYEALALGVAPVRCEWLKLAESDDWVALPAREQLFISNFPSPTSPLIPVMGDPIAWFTVLPHSERFLAGRRILFTSSDEEMARLTRAAGGMVLPLRSFTPKEEGSLPDFVHIPAGRRAKLHYNLASVPLLEPSWLHEALAKNFHHSRQLLSLPEPQNGKENLTPRLGLSSSPPRAPISPRTPSFYSPPLANNHTDNADNPDRMNTADQSPQPESLLLCGTVEKGRDPMGPRTSRSLGDDCESEEEGVRRKGAMGEEEEKEPNALEFPLPRRQVSQLRSAARRIDWGLLTAPPPLEESEREGKESEHGGGFGGGEEDSLLRKRAQRGGGGFASLAGRTASSPSAFPPFPPVVVGEDYYFYLPRATHAAGVMGSEFVDNEGGWSGRTRPGEGEQTAPQVALGRVVGLSELSPPPPPPVASRESFLQQPPPSAMIVLQVYEVRRTFLQQNPCTNALERQTTVFLSSRQCTIPIEALLFDTPVYVVNASAMQHIYILENSSEGEHVLPSAATPS